MKLFFLKIKIFKQFLLILCFFGISHQLFAQTETFKLKVDSAFERLIAVADTDGDKKITVEDDPKMPFLIPHSQGDSVAIREIYYLSNLLQELAVARAQNKDSVEISIDRIKEPPTQRISRRIETQFWDDLTRTIDRKGIQKILRDTKASDGVQRLYVPATDTSGIRYYKDLQQELSGFEVVVLPEKITPQYVKSINDKPGLLALKIENDRGVPFVVPGGRFNEMYGWDSYFEGVGLLIDGRIDLAKAMVDNFVYQINHYGKILNANRSYYLTRTQPPFMSSFVREVYEAMEVKDEAWLREALNAAIKEYEQVWMEEGERLTGNGLNRYYAQGIGIPPETEKGHFNEVLQEFAEKYGLKVSEFVEQYQSGTIDAPEVDEYFLHDRSLRESGHDTSWRLENRAAHLNTVDLNSLLYKYEKDFEFLIDEYFDEHFTTSAGKKYTDDYWEEKAETRKALVNEYLWNEQDGSFYDYNFKTGEQTKYISATNFYPLWSGLASEAQAERMVPQLMQDLKAQGGILSSAKSSVEKTATNDVQRQWDYPYGWAPHQMLLWQGLLDYGYEEEAYELIYRWLWMITKNAVDYNGTIPEKYNVVDATHKVYAEYGNVGTEFDYITTSGFGWMNASYQLGLELLPKQYRERLNELVTPKNAGF
ncbi:trehalase family glycosidase [Salinimicrobium sp. MT39]|uniref:Trehalase family glycosidase n=1 Tax=Salinimicrobium profundisediminis TaxID=2994553 RepID=A0A9X3CX86_9FLAO|nr:trehalase family glycosidase [Salinimicrobium profundisediminis]MCX2837195.1 trehalase family glycosidase [Salinimicrobium profundisediminis]